MGRIVNPAKKYICQDKSFELWGVDREIGIALPLRNTRPSHPSNATGNLSHVFAPLDPVPDTYARPSVRPPVARPGPLDWEGGGLGHRLVIMPNSRGVGDSRSGGR